MAGRGLVLLLVLVAAWSAALRAQTVQAEVLSIGDGDTIRVREAGRVVTVRLACIDAPETAQRPYGMAARRHLQQRLPVGQEVTLRLRSIDRYGRSVAEVIGESNIGLAMVEDGQAFVYRHYLGGCDAREYLDAEYRARRHRFGVWQPEGGITRPWDFRPSPSRRVRPGHLSRCAQRRCIMDSTRQPAAFSMAQRERHPVAAESQTPF